MSFRAWIYFAVTALAAGLSMLRGLVVASASEEVDFARYAVVLSTGYFLGYLLSFGSIESSYKAFPRLMVSGRVDDMHMAASAVSAKLSARGVVSGFALLVFGLAFGVDWFFECFVAVLFAIVASYTSLVASVQRASGDYVELASAGFLRSVLAIVLVAPAAYFYDVYWVIAAELVAGFLGVLASSRLAGVKLRALPYAGSSLAADTGGLSSGVNSERGLLVSIGALFVSVPFYLDRMFVAAAFGPHEAAKYALVAIFLGAAVLLFNAVTQRVGTEAIKLAASTRSIGGATAYLARWAFVGILSWLIFVCLVAAAFYSNLLPPGLEKYRVSSVLLVPAAALGALSVTALIEFLLLAADGEREIFLSSSLYLAIILLSAAWVWENRPSLDVLIWLMVAARSAYLLMLCNSLVTRRGGKTLNKLP